MNRKAQAEEPENAWINVLPWRKFLQIPLVARDSVYIYLVPGKRDSVHLFLITDIMQLGESNS